MEKIFLFFFAFILGNVYSQQSINASGGNASGVGGSASYSVGQLVYSTYSGSTGTINEGIQQPFEIFILKNENFEVFDQIVLYPNPTSYQLFLNLVETNNDLKYELINVVGELLLNDKIAQTSTIINLENLPAGIYILTVSSLNNSKSKSYKIIKNN